MNLEIEDLIDLKGPQCAQKKKKEKPTFRYIIGKYKTITERTF